MRPSRAARAAAFAAALVLAGCASRGPQLPPVTVAGLPASVELDSTPFFPQQDYQCGPAALATVLVASGAQVSPDELVAEVYLPGRKGSLQAELIAAARARGRVDEAVLFAREGADVAVLGVQLRAVAEVLRNCMKPGSV